MSRTPHSPDLTSYRAVHHAIRTGSRRLAAVVTTIDPRDRDRVTALRRYWTGYANEVLAHHTVEDDIFFPALADRTSSMREHTAQLDAEHHLLDELMDEAAALIESFGDVATARLPLVLARLAQTMDDHLDLEDRHVLPLFAAHFSADEYAELEQKAMKSLGVGRQAAFTVPFVVCSLDDEMQAEVLATAPFALRVLLRLTRRRHQRLDATVFAGLQADTPPMAVAR